MHCYQELFATYAFKTRFLVFFPLFLLTFPRRWQRKECHTLCYKEELREGLARASVRQDQQDLLTSNPSGEGRGGGGFPGNMNQGPQSRRGCPCHTWPSEVLLTSCPGHAKMSSKPKLLGWSRRPTKPQAIPMLPSAQSISVSLAAFPVSLPLQSPHSFPIPRPHCHPQSLPSPPRRRGGSQAWTLCYPTVGTKINIFSLIRPMLSNCCIMGLQKNYQQSHSPFPEGVSQET